MKESANNENYERLMKKWGEVLRIGEPLPLSARRATVMLIEPMETWCLETTERIKHENNKGN